MTRRRPDSIAMGAVSVAVRQRLRDGDAHLYQIEDSQLTLTFIDDKDKEEGSVVTIDDSHLVPFDRCGVALSSFAEAAGSWWQQRPQLGSI